jgi:hypothetical protein
VALVRIDVPEECIASITGVKKISEVGTTSVVTSNKSTVQRTAMSSSLLVTDNDAPSSPILVTLMMGIPSAEMSGATRRNIQEDSILYSHHHENLETYIALTGLALYRIRNVSHEVRTRFLFPR